MNHARNRSILLFFLIFTAFLTFVFTTYKQYGVSWDESLFWYSGKVTSEHFLDTNFLIKEISYRHLLTQGKFFDVIYYLLQKHNGQELDIERLHLVKALFSSLALVAIFLILKTLTKNSFTASIGMVLLIFSPRWLGDIFDNHMDSIATWLYAWQLFLGVKLLLEQKLARLPIWFLSLVILSAFAFSHRVILIGISIIALLFLLPKLKKVQSRTTVVRVIVISILVFLAILFLVDPYIRYAGIAGIFQKISVLLQTPSFFPQQTFFEGRIYETTNLPWYYLPKWIAISTPILSLLFFGFGCYAVLQAWKKRPSVQSTKVYLFILLAFLLPIIFVLLARPVLYDAWRHTLFLVVPFVLIATFGIQKLFEAKNRYVKIVTVFLFVFNILLTAWEMRLLHPYEYLYFNSFVSGLPGAVKNYETDYWGKSFREATLWLAAEARKDKLHVYRVSVCDSPDLATPYFEKNMVLVESLEQADYFICYTRMNTHKLVDDSKTVFVVEREGVGLNYVKKLQ